MIFEVEVFKKYFLIFAENSSESWKDAINLEEEPEGIDLRGSDVTRFEKKPTKGASKKVAERRLSREKPSEKQKPRRKRSTSASVTSRDTPTQVKPTRPPATEQVVPIEIPRKFAKTPVKQAPVAAPATSGAPVVDINAMINSFISKSSNIELIHEKEKPVARKQLTDSTDAPALRKTPAKTPTTPRNECIMLSSEEDASSDVTEPEPVVKRSSKKITYAGDNDVEAKSKQSKHSKEKEAEVVVAKKVKEKRRSSAADISAALDALESATRSALSAEASKENEVDGSQNSGADASDLKPDEESQDIGATETESKAEVESKEDEKDET